MKRQILFILIILPLLTFAGQPGKIKLIVIPDTQNNANKYPEVFDSEFDWISANASDYDFVLHVGDVVESSSNATQWSFAKSNFNKLKGKIPYAFCMGNHDVSIRENTAENATADLRISTAANNAFKASDFEAFGGAYEEEKIDNTYHLFSAGGFDWLVLSIEFVPNDLVLNWANNVIEEHPDRLIIILTHSYMHYGSNTDACSRDNRVKGTSDWRKFTASYENQTPESMLNDGEMMWNKLVSKHKNIFAVFSGHILGSGTAKLVSFGENMNKVYQMMSNYQNQVREMNDEGKNGYIRLITIDPQSRTMDVRTWSPFLNQYHPNNIRHNFRFGGVDLNEY